MKFKILHKQTFLVNLIPFILATSLVLKKTLRVAAKSGLP